MSRKLEDVQKDVEEMIILTEKAERPYVKNILQKELVKLQSELSAMKVKACASEKAATNPQSRCVTVELSTYAWDQSNKYMKIYIDLKNIQQLSKENITCNFEEKSLDLTVSNLDNKNYHFKVKKLAGSIIPSDSSFKIKTDSLVLMLMKKNQTNWDHVSEVSIDKKKEKIKKPTLDDDKDPSEGIMDILKNIYDDGDDEMKRTISKAWYKSRNKVSEL
ncbi:calcyclin-binding protein isoform X1 [Octopus bimaculoides]|uniref:Calcyclin-binding protein n=2 Tax=Octopus bimaculoides TaxID=37653 RepID=A0A0L8H169_OCTBM|nr:calcyclin-binding protein isoform X1 [Octopus bimaculoides]|eukprot:XP_014776311.1 PREDICTED: calcyclin-binding protein-like isoform X1 [Octopus bimaculoides]